MIRRYGMALLLLAACGLWTWAEEKVGDGFSGSGALNADRWSITTETWGRLNRNGSGYVELIVGTDGEVGEWFKGIAMAKESMTSPDHWVEMSSYRITGSGSFNLCARSESVTGFNGGDDLYYVSLLCDPLRAGTKYAVYIKKRVDGTSTTLHEEALTAGFFAARRSLLLSVSGSTIRAIDSEGAFDIEVSDTDIGEGEYVGFYPLRKDDGGGTFTASSFSAGIGLMPGEYGGTFEPLPDDWEVPEDSTLFSDPDLWLIYEELRKARYYEDRGELMIYEKLKELRVDLSGISDDTSRIVELMEVDVPADTAAQISQDEREAAEDEHSSASTTTALVDAVGDGGSSGVFDFLPDVADGQAPGTFWFGLKTGVGDVPAFGIDAGDPILSPMWELCRVAVGFFLLLFLGWEAWHASLWTISG
jgi:hypothetical protein